MNRLISLVFLASLTVHGRGIPRVRRQDASALDVLASEIAVVESEIVTLPSVISQLENEVQDDTQGLFNQIVSAEKDILQMIGITVFPPPPGTTATLEAASATASSQTPVSSSVDAASIPSTLVTVAISSTTVIDLSQPSSAQNSSNANGSSAQDSSVVTSSIVTPSSVPSSSDFAYSSNATTSSLVGSPTDQSSSNDSSPTVLSSSADTSVPTAYPFTSAWNSSDSASPTSSHIFPIWNTTVSSMLMNSITLASSSTASVSGFNPLATSNVMRAFGRPNDPPATLADLASYCADDRFSTINLAFQRLADGSFTSIFCSSATTPFSNSTTSCSALAEAAMACQAAGKEVLISLTATQVGPVFEDDSGTPIFTSELAGVALAGDFVQVFGGDGGLLGDFMADGIELVLLSQTPAAWQTPSATPTPLALNNTNTILIWANGTNATAPVPTAIPSTQNVDTAGGILLFLTTLRAAWDQTNPFYITVSVPCDMPYLLPLGALSLVDSVTVRFWDAEICAVLGFEYYTFLQWAQASANVIPGLPMASGAATASSVSAVSMPEPTLPPSAPSSTVAPQSDSTLFAAGGDSTSTTSDIAAAPTDVFMSAFFDKRQAVDPSQDLILPLTLTVTDSSVATATDSSSNTTMTDSSVATTTDLIFSTEVVTASSPDTTTDNGNIPTLTVMILSTELVSSSSPTNSLLETSSAADNSSPTTSSVDDNSPSTVLVFSTEVVTAGAPTDSSLGTSSVDNSSPSSLTDTSSPSSITNGASSPTTLSSLGSLSVSNSEVADSFSSADDSLVSSLTSSAVAASSISADLSEASVLGTGVLPVNFTFSDTSSESVPTATSDMSSSNSTSVTAVEETPPTSLLVSPATSTEPASERTSTVVVVMPFMNATSTNPNMGSSKATAVVVAGNGTLPIITPTPIPVTLISPPPLASASATPIPPSAQPVFPQRLFLGIDADQQTTDLVAAVQAARVDWRTGGFTGETNFGGVSISGGSESLVEASGGVLELIWDVLGSQD